MTHLILKSLASFSLAAFLALALPLSAQENITAMTEADLRSMVPFGPDANLKYAECETKSFPTCTYIWGVPDSSDAKRIERGGKPEGDRLMTIFARANKAQDFDRVLAIYKDAVPVPDLGATAVWSDTHSQLSLITKDNLIIHVYVQVGQLDSPKATAMQVADFLLGEL